MKSAIPDAKGAETSLGLFILVAASMAAAMFYPQFSLNHDASWYLVSTGMFLDGTALYRDILEINPPLAFYLTVVPIALSRLFGIDPTLAYFLYCIAIACLSCVWSLRIIARSNISQWQRRGLFFGVLIAQFVLPISEFGQREHLMLMFGMPFVLVQIFQRDLQTVGMAEKVAIGLAASLGFLLKPHFLAIPAVLALVRLWKQRDLSVLRDPAYLTLAAAAIAYVLFIALVHPAYLERIVPLGISVYASYGMPAKTVLLQSEFAAIVVLGAVLLRSKSPLHSGTSLLMAACGGAAIGYLLQFKGWNYQIIPLSAFLAMTAVWLLASNLEEEKRDTMQAILLAFVIVLTLVPQLARGPYESATSASFEGFVEGEGQSILVLSTNVSAAFPFVNEVRGKWASHYSAQWLVPGVTGRLNDGACKNGGEECANLQEIAQFARNSVLKDLEQFQPDLIFVDERENKAYFAHKDFDYFRFLSEDTRFRKIRSCYTRAGETIGYGVFRKTC